MRERLRVLTWHVHGSYLYYLSHTPVDFFVLSKPERGPGYMGRYGHFSWGNNVHDMPVEALKEAEFDCVLFQSHQHYLHDQHLILTTKQRRLPMIYLEHDPPRENPVSTCHPVNDPNVLLVHVTNFNNLMWDSGSTPTTVIRHGVTNPQHVRYSGEFNKGIVVINHLHQRGRRLGVDIFQHAAKLIPLDLVGMGSKDNGGLGEIRHDVLPQFQARYRFFFNPIRYTSLGLSVCEAMMIGMPIIGLGTTEMTTTIENGVTGFIDTDIEKLIEHMFALLNDPYEARRLGKGAHEYAQEHFNIARFARDWERAFNSVTNRKNSLSYQGISV